MQLILFQQNSFAQDSIFIEKPTKQKFHAEPLKATMMAVAFPGLGQIYNRKYWKIPVVYAGFGALVYAIGFNSSNYTTYLTALQDYTDRIPATNRHQSLPRLSEIDPATYDEFAHPETFQFYKDQMLRMVDYYKRYRDLSYIGIGAWYLVSILDANVDASLFNFDVSDDLEIGVLPVQMALPGGYVGAGINVSLKIDF